jgi:uncharacterized protein YfaS (alpha-2-macroglobulin family)
MKSIIIALSILMGLTSDLGQAYDYDKAWLEVEKYINEGLPKSALEKVEEIHKMALNDKNDPQIVKSVVYLTRLTIQSDEKGIEASIEKLESVVKSANAPTKQITASYLAELYQRYFDNYRWEISQRSELTGEKSIDFRTWSTQQFLTTIESWYLFSLEDKKAVNVPVESFKIVINKYDAEAVIFRPTIYEVLADRAFTFFNNYDSYSNENSQSFQVSESWYFEDAETFSKKDIITTDISSAKYKMLRLYQDILSTQIENKNKLAAADHDLKRLEYVYSQSTLEKKQELYKKSLENLAEENVDIDFYTEIIAVLANQMRSETEDSLSNVKTISLCETAIKKYPNSTGAAKCQNIINDIKKPSLQIFAEQVYPTKNHILLAIDYNNVSNVTLETVKLDKDFFNFNQRRNQDEIVNYLKNAKKVTTQKHVLKPSPSLKSQRMELSHTNLPYGSYAAIVRSTDKNKEVFQYVVFHVSDLAYTSYMSNEARTFIVSDRISGKAVKGANVTLYYQQYNPSSRKNENIKSEKYTTDNNGKVKVNGLTDKNTKVVIEYKKDILDLNQYHYNYNRYTPEPYKFAEIFTDRAIYRPGQTVYFKAILLENDQNQVPTILPNKNIEVNFKDANYQEISSLSLKSNEFGSVNGSFTIPLGKLNGNFTLEVGSNIGINGQKSIQVEEYKRPTFEVKADAITGEYKVNDNIKVTGSALTLAGTNVDGAIVKYKVVRSARFPGWGWYWRMPYQSAEFIVAEGETTTDGEGKYTFEFQAIPDLKIAKKDQPVFNYNIQVDVVDQRGETRSTSATASVGYTAFSLSSNVQKEIDLADIKPLKVTATSTNGQTIQTKGNVKISQLQEPKTVQISKYWDGKVDIPLLRSISDKHFPQYPVLADRDFTSWPVAKQVFSGEFNTNDSIQIKSALKAGVYKIELEATDKYGEKVSSENYMVVTDFGKGVYPKSDFLFTKVNNKVLEPGASFDLTFGTNEKSLTVHTIIEKDGRILLEKSQEVNKKGTITLPITENHRGGINVKTTYIIQNRTFQNDYHIDVPWSNKQLQITYETFRDKTLPGAKEEYRIKIKGLKQDKVAAEMVAAMYDASLDQFIANSWRTDFYPNSYAQLNIEVPGFNLIQGQYYYYGNGNIVSVKQLLYPSLFPLIDNYGYYGGGRGEVMMRSSMSEGMPAPAAMMDEVASKQAVDAEAANVLTKDNITQGDTKITSNEQPILVRKNLKETVFFFPEVKTDAEGNIILAFTINEALTKWKLMSFAHTKDLMTGYDERFVQTQKNLMVFPNAPRFVRDGDVISFSAKVSNLSETSLTGQARLQLFDAITMTDITNELVKSGSNVSFDIEKGKSQGLAWDLVIPNTKYQAVTYRITAQAGDHTDGEENTIPVVTNSMLVTESMPMWIKGKETKSFTFNAFKNNVSPTKKDFRFTVEYTSNPVWYAIQALPYMNTTNNFSTQAVVDKFYANALASKIANAHPKIKAVFDQWSSRDKDALLSNLSKNEELKSALLEETPWVRQALSEAEQKRNIAILFDLNKLADEKANAIQKLKERQLTNGGFSWLTGGRDDVYTTQNVLENIGHLYHLGALEINDPELTTLTANALRYMDDELVIRYTKLQEYIKRYGGNINDDHLDDLSVHYLYVKTFFKHVNATPASKEAREYYYGQAKKYWLKRGLYTQAMIGLILQRNDDKTAKSIVKSLREKSFSNDELGMYWNEGNGFYWHQLPIERHALMIELFSEVELKKDEADKMKIWLLKNKQTNHWKTSKSTAAAIYALLLQGETGDISQWVTESVQPVITVGKDVINTDARNTEAGTGYIKKTYITDNFNKDLATIKIKNDNTSVAWGAAYYQYFEQLDKIKTFTDTPLKINKKLYKVVASGKGDELVEVKENTNLKPGDKLKVRIELVVDRQMEYVHMKDMRASGLEPTNVISEYKYQGQLGYYETTKDLATHFYFSYLPKGTFVFEYPLAVVHKGDFSGGITSIECMYAPEFSSHSEGIRVKVK